MWCGVRVFGSCDWEYGGGGEQMGHRRENDSQERRESRITAIAGAFAGALLAADEVAAEIAIREAMDASLGTAEIDEKVIAPALWLVGELWERGKISVADEHIATEITIRVLALQREVQRVAQSRGGRRVMLATPPASSTWSRFGWWRIFCVARAMTL